jgi:hypothetical protein
LFHEALNLDRCEGTFAAGQFDAVGKDNQGRYGIYFETLRQCGQAFGVHLGNDKPFGVAARNTLYLGGHRLTRAAPIGPEIHQHGQVGAANQRFEGDLLIDLDGSIQPGQIHLTFAAASGIAQMGKGYPVLLAALRADFDHSFIIKMRRIHSLTLRPG